MQHNLVARAVGVRKQFREYLLGFGGPISPLKDRDRVDPNTSTQLQDVLHAVSGILQSPNLLHACSFIELRRLAPNYACEIVAAFHNWDFRTKYAVINRHLAQLNTKDRPNAKSYFSLIIDCITSSVITLGDAKFIIDDVVPTLHHDVIDIFRRALTMTPDAYNHIVARGFAISKIIEHIYGNGHTVIADFSDIPYCCDHIYMPSIESRPWITDSFTLYFYVCHSITPWPVLEEHIRRVGGNLAEARRGYYLSNPHVSVKAITRKYFEDYVNDVVKFNDRSDDESDDDLLHDGRPQSLHQSRMATHLDTEICELMHHVDEELYIPSYAPLSWWQSLWTDDLTDYDPIVFARAMINAGYSYRDIYGLRPQSLETHRLYIREILKYYRYCIEEIAYAFARQLHEHSGSPGGLHYHLALMDCAGD